MFLTLYQLLKHCEKAVEIYNDIAEDNGMCGDVDTFNYYDEKSKNLQRLIKAMSEQLQTNQNISLNYCIHWLNESENKAVKETIYDALETIKKDREYKIQNLTEEIEFCDLFLEKNKIHDSVGDIYDN